MWQLLRTIPYQTRETHRESRGVERFSHRPRSFLHALIRATSSPKGSSISMHCSSCTVVVTVLVVMWMAVGVDAADDADLVAVVQQQAEALQAMQARLTSLEAEVQDAHSQLRDAHSQMAVFTSNVSRVESDMDHLKSRVSLTVAFSAQMSEFHVNVGTNAPFIFDVVITDIGNAYNSHNGIFTTPHGGLYAFYFDMMDDRSSTTMHAAIEKSGTVLGVTSVDGSPNAYDKGSVLVTTHLNAGEQVFVRRTDGGNLVHGNRYCHFSGFLLVADM